MYLTIKFLFFSQNFYILLNSLQIIKNTNICVWILSKGNSRPTLVREISHIQFPKLHEINLANNQIGTIESIGHILMPHLETISFFTPFLTKGEMTWGVWSPSEKSSGLILHASQSVFICSSSGKFYLRWVIPLRVFLPVPRVCSGRRFDDWGRKMAEKSGRSSVFTQISDGVYGRLR